jgi:hypothetical protein
MNGFDVRIQSVAHDQIDALVSRKIGGLERAVLYQEMVELRFLCYLGVRLEILTEDTVQYLDTMAKRVSNYFRVIGPPLLLRSYPFVLAPLWENGERLKRTGEIVSLDSRDLLVVRSAYEKVLLLYLQMVQDAGIRMYFESLFWRTEDWRETISQNLRPQDVANSAESNEKTAAVVVYGFLRWLGYQAELHNTLTTAPSSSSEAKRFVRQVREIVTWRLRSPSEESADRIQFLKRLVVANSVAEVTSGDGAGLERDLNRILDEILELRGTR